jgi:hypothetical protein
MVNSTNAVMIAAIAVIVFTFLFGVIGMWCEYTCMVVFFGIFMFCAVLFLYAASFLSLAAGYYVRGQQMNIGSGAVSCNSNYTNVLQGIQIIDAYVQNVDRLYCSSSCPCKITNIANQAYWTFQDPVNYLQWSQSATTGASTFQDGCSAATQNTAYNLTGNQPGFFQFNATLFATKWGDIEKNNNCTGFCSASYSNTFSIPNATNLTAPATLQTRNVKQMKYLFSDINRGVPTQPCFIPVMIFMTDFFINFGAMALIISMILTIVFLLICSWCCCPAAEEEHKQNVEMSKV